MDTSDQNHNRRKTDLAGTTDPILQDLERYWQTLRHSHRIPARNDIEPSKIDAVLPHSFILQRVAPGTARMRVAGQKLHEILKMDARGMPLTTVFQPHAHNQVKDLLEVAFTEPAIICLPLVSPGNLMRPELNGTMLLLPLRDHQGSTSRVLGALVADSNEGTRPRRFEISPDRKVRHEAIGGRLVTVSLVHKETVPAKRPDATTRPALQLVVNNS